MITVQSTESFEMKNIYICLLKSQRSELSAEMKIYICCHDHGVVKVAATWGNIFMT